MGRSRCIGVRFRPASFVSRFTATVRKFIYFQKRITKLGPSYYNCNDQQSSCTRRQAQSRKGCPTCEYTIQHNIFLKELDSELAKVKGGTREGKRKWPRATLLQLVVEVGSLASVKKKDPKRPASLDLLVSIYKGEIAKMQAIESFNTASASHTTTIEPADVGDFD